MDFEFDEKRATQAAALLIRLMGGKANHAWLLTALYLADRQSLAATGAPMAGASFCITSGGPIASDVHNCIKGEAACLLWSQHIERIGHDVQLLQDPGDGELSDFDVETLTALFERHKGRTHVQMVDTVRGLPEWRDPGPTPAPLPVAEILQAEGFSSCEIAELEARNSHVLAVRRMLG